MYSQGQNSVRGVTWPCGMGACCESALLCNNQHTFLEDRMFGSGPMRVGGNACQKMKDFDHVRLRWVRQENRWHDRMRLRAEMSPTLKWAAWGAGVSGMSRMMRSGDEQPETEALWLSVGAGSMRVGDKHSFSENKTRCRRQPDGRAMVAVCIESNVLECVYTGVGPNVLHVHPLEVHGKLKTVISSWSHIIVGRCQADDEWCLRTVQGGRTCRVGTSTGTCRGLISRSAVVVPTETHWSIDCLHVAAQNSCLFWAELLLS